MCPLDDASLEVASPELSVSWKVLTLDDVSLNYVSGPRVMTTATRKNIGYPWVRRHIDIAPEELHLFLRRKKSPIVLFLYQNIVQ